MKEKISKTSILFSGFLFVPLLLHANPVIVYPGTESPAATVVFGFLALAGEAFFLGLCLRNKEIGRFVKNWMIWTFPSFILFTIYAVSWHVSYEAQGNSLWLGIAIGELIIIIIETIILKHLRRTKDAVSIRTLSKYFVFVALANIVSIFLFVTMIMTFSFFYF